MNPFIDDCGILRVGGRLRASSLPYSAKHPSLLLGRHPFSRLIIRHEHERHFHAGPQTTLAAIRLNYWLTSARGIVRQVIQKCVTCFRSSPKKLSAIMRNLPGARVNVLKKLFKSCGVDYAGPFYYKEGTRRNSKLIKCYIAIFVCFATKAVHIELSSNLSSEAFLNVLKRFIARRGYPSDIYSDNGLNFVGAECELAKLANLFKSQISQQLIVEYMAKQNIQWHFISPRASPHYGGLWEAAVKAANCKLHLVRMTKESHLRHEELQTLLVQIEAILNSRPLTPISADPKDLNALTPGHFLIGSLLTSYPEPQLDGLPTNRLSRWQHVEQLRQNFWRRWSREYLHQCQQRNKWQMQNVSIYNGQMVLLKEDNTPPLLWPLGRIIEIYPGQNGIHRVASVRTSKGIYKRPITRLCLLPFETKE